MKALLSLFVLVGSSVSLAETKVISIDDRLFGSRIDTVVRNSAALLGNSADAQCPNGVLSLKNVTFQVVDGNSRVVKSEAKLSYREIARIAKCSHGSVHAELVAYKKEKDVVEKMKLAELQEAIKIDSRNPPINELHKMNLSKETVRKVEQDLEFDAKKKVEDLQGQYYETYD